MATDPLSLRQRMVEEQLRTRGIYDSSVLSSFLSVPRHLFVPGVSLEQAHADRPHAIGCEQTISQPYIVALMLQLLRLQPQDVALEIGTGSGYVTALLSLLTRHVYSLEAHPQLLNSARQRLEDLGVQNASLRAGDGTLGWEETAPFDAVLVSAAAPEVPPPLLKQLADGGRLVIPIGERSRQELVLIQKHSDHYQRTTHGDCVFVPLLGRYGWLE